jgi:hypothetical protein
MAEYIFGEIVFIGAGTQIYPSHTPSAIIRRIDDKWIINGDALTADMKAEQIMVDNGYDGYLCPETYTGRIILVDREGKEKLTYAQVMNS